MLIVNNYKIHLEIDLDKTIFSGATEIKINTENPIETVVLNAEELEIKSCKVKMNGNSVECSFSLNSEKQELVITIPEKMKNDIIIAINYTGKYHDDLGGLYRSKYKYGGQEKFVASTQFEESYARRAFPCFDHPSMKATFDVEYVIDENLIGIGNTPILEEKKFDDNKKLIRFEQTPKMCTYLLYFGVGEFEIVEDSSEGHLVRVVTTQGKAKYGKFAIDIAQKSLSFCEEYTGLKYPISKCDLIGVPDFQFGAILNSNSELFG